MGECLEIRDCLPVRQPLSSGTPSHVRKRRDASLGVSFYKSKFFYRYGKDLVFSMGIQDFVSSFSHILKLSISLLT